MIIKKKKKHKHIKISWNGVIAHMLLYVRVPKVKKCNFFFSRNFCVFFSFFLLILESSNGIRHNFGDDYTRNTLESALWAHAQEKKKIHITISASKGRATHLLRGPFFYCCRWFWLKIKNVHFKIDKDMIRCLFLLTHHLWYVCHASISYSFFILRFVISSHRFDFRFLWIFSVGVNNDDDGDVDYCEPLQLCHSKYRPSAEKHQEKSSSQKHQ